ncbi:aminopeptidase N-like [Seriola lalandi dorsalis]|uniref:Aminopeptidase n=1 Tax=Seriola lalandi dorsalis TaxID=1841481 RepID=A0A3B4YTY4_SERLL|nr:aminopeptidase N-like [Seriola lalandi dorsalis]XP_056242670.1 alanyl (membrane) aminopeptidase-like b [Seriola aureovittata]
MPKQLHISKAIAATFVVLTVSAIAGLVTMIIMYQSELSTMDPTAPPTIPSTTTAPPPVMRLPKNLIPESYEVVLWPRLYTQIIEVINVTSPNQTMLFTGNSTVNFHCVQKTSTIYLHSMELNVSDAKVKNRDNNQDIDVTSTYYHKDQSDFLVVELNTALMAEGNYSLFLSFHGEISDALEGLYVSSYIEEDDEGDPNAERFLAATNLEPTLARRVFPCFDEPEMKAVFHVTIIHRQNTIALGNAERYSTNTHDGWQYTRFNPTPRMSTYLFAFTVSEFESIPSAHERVKIKTFARPEAIKAGHASYAANITGKILTFYEKLFGIDYTQKKLDQIALPDLNPAAMENWGLITYQEGGLLYEEGVSSLLHKEVIATLIAHEIAHQWFGNLVTMKWWNEIWLNEGFATYMTYFAVDHVEPSFNVKDTFILSSLHEAFEEDALASSHPLNPPPQDIQTTFEIIQMFDSITYSKGAIVLRMLADVVEERVFNKGIRMYLRDFSFKNTDESNLWDYIQEAVTEDGGHTKVAKMMDTWTNQIGYPVITINTTNGEIYQKRFLFNDTSESSLWWEVPIRVMSNTTGTQLTWLRTPGPETMDKFLSKHGEWILANVNCTGYYRVNYNPENWDALLTQLETNPHRIPLMNRGQLVDDAFNLARAKLLNVALALNSTRFLRREKAYLPWESAVRNLEYFVLMFDRTEVYGPMQAYLREQVRELYGFFKNYTEHSQVPEDHSLQYNQILAIEVACSNGLPECVEMVQQMFAFWMKNNTNIIHPNLRSVIYCQAVAYGGKAEWEFAWKKYQSSSDISEKDQLRKALSCTKTIWLLNRYLEYTLDPEKIRLMDVASTINYISENVAGQALAWNFIRGHWEYVSQGDAATVIEGVTSRFSTQFELEELERFATDYALDSATRAVYQAIEQTQVNIEWVGENKDVILEWFESQSSS